MFGTEALALMNTDQRDGYGTLDATWLLAVLPGWGIHPDRSVTSADLDALRQLRTLLRRLTVTVVKGQMLSARELAPLNKILAATPVRVQIETEQDSYILDMTAVSTAGWREAAAREITGSFVAMLRRDPARLRVCAAPDCAIAFWDGTRSRTRTWCDTRTCGNRVRVNRHRAAHSRAPGDS